MLVQEEVPRFNSLNHASEWANRIKYNQQLYERLEILKEHRAFEIIYNGNIHNGNEARRLWRVIKDYQCYKLALIIMDRHKDVGSTVRISVEDVR